jgi:isoquinoline 1-oxidoreductase beta subunit
VASRSAGTTRRDFLKAGGLATGALVLGFALPERGRAAAAPATATGARTQVNAYVKLGTDGLVTMIVPKAEMGQGVYTGYAQILADELDVDWANVRVESAPVDAVYNAPFAPIQFTGGSMSVMTGFEVLRHAGAAARAMLVAAAAAELGVPADGLRTENGAVVDPATGRRLAYGALAPRAAQLTPPEKPTPKPRSEWRYIGKPMSRVDSREKSDGSAVFGMDVRLPGLHYAMIARPPVFGAEVKSFDAAAARRVRGVVDVVQVPAGVAVVATNTWAARTGRDALQVEWTAGKAAGFSTAAIERRYAELARTPGTVAREQGDVVKAAAGATRRLEADYSAPYLAHAPMEPLNCAVAFSDAGCDIHVGTQFQSVDRAVAAQVAGLPPEKVRIHTTFLGGGFGRRANISSDFIREAVAIAKAAKRPVLTVWTREDDVRGGYYRPYGHERLTAALGDDGLPVAMTYTSVVQSLLKGTLFEAMMVDKKTGLDATTHEGAIDGYAIPNFRVDVHDPAQPVPVLWWRSVGHTHSGFAMESFIDECAHAAGRDPVAYRLALLKDDPRHVAALKLAAEKAGWGTPLPPGRARGVAVHESFGSVVAEVAEVSLQDGRPHVHRVVAAIHCGTAVNPALIAHQLESAVTFGLSAALDEEITIDDGRVRESNFNDYPMMRMREMPLVEAHVVPSDAPPTGVGEPGTPPIAPAVANALFALTGVRARKLPLKHTEFAKKASRLS